MDKFESSINMVIAKYPDSKPMNVGFMKNILHEAFQIRREWIEHEEASEQKTHEEAMEEIYGPAGQD